MNVPAKLTAPDLDSALLMIRDFAVREHMGPDELLDMVRMGIVERAQQRVAGLPTDYQPLTSEGRAGKLPSSCQPANWRGTLPVESAVGALGLLFNVGEAVVRLALPLADAVHLYETVGVELARYRRRSQTERSSGMPSVAGSIPDEGQKQ